MAWTKSLTRAMGFEKGGAVRTALDGFWSTFGLERLTMGTAASRRTAFTISVVALAAKMAKADGVPLPVEAAAFERVFPVAEADRAHVKRVYDLASQCTAGYEIYASRIANLLEAEPELKRTVLECLFHVAAADGVLHPAEDAFLRKVAEIFGYSEKDYLCIRRAFVHDPDSPYDVLGISAAAPISEIRARYRRLVKEHHPDKLVSEGVPAEFLAAADRRLAAINSAFDAVMRERGLKEPVHAEAAS